MLDKHLIAATDPISKKESMVFGRITVSRFFLMNFLELRNQKKENLTTKPPRQFGSVIRKHQNSKS